MSNKKNGAGFYVTIALIVVVLAAIIYIVVSGSMPKGADVPDDLGAVVESEVENETEAEADTETESEAEAEAEVEAEVEGTDNEISDEQIEE